MFWALLFVGVAHFFHSSWADDLSSGAKDDLHAWGRSEITVREIDARIRARNRLWKVKVITWGIRLSFALLIAGGVVAAVPFLKKF